jgi:dTDP-glucose 4,6-dehydratase/UDP-glucose 4-epimerase
MYGCDSVIHLAYPQGRKTDSRTILDIAVQGMSSVLNCCEIAEVRDLMLISSPEVYQVATQVPTSEAVPLTVPDVLNSHYAYGGGKIISELMAVAWARSGVLDRLTIARPHNIYGQNAGHEHVIPQISTRMCNLIAEHTGNDLMPFPIQGSGQETRAFCHISDCIDALILLLDKAESVGVYHVGSSEEVTIEHLVHLIGDHYRQQVKVVPSSPSAGPSRRCPDISKLQSLGYEPRIPLAQGIGPVLNWYQNNG